MEKIIIFEYIVYIFLKEYSLITWLSEKDVMNWTNDLSILKIQKLLFFLSTKSKKILNIFEFYALPYWPVDIDTYTNYSKLKYFEISTKNTILKDSFELDNENLKSFVNEAINSLKSENSSIFKLGAFDLVNITHKWSCWKDNKTFRWLITRDEILSSISYYK